MPDYYAHLQFGAEVLAALPESLRLDLERERGAYTLGQYGPDPLYFYRPVRGSAVRALGRAMHRQPVRPVMERLRLAVEEGRAFSAGYAAGFLCHFALDSRCHPYVRQRESGSKIAHAGIEGEFDRFLMARNGVDLRHETPMPAPRMPDAFYELLERYAYPGVKGWQYREGLESYRKACVWHTRAAGSRMTGRLLDAAARVSRRGARFRDLALKRAAAAYAHCDEELLALLENEVPVTAEKLTAFFKGDPLDAWFDRDFNGGNRS